MTPDDVDVTAAYDCFTVSSTMMLERFGFCEPERRRRLRFERRHRTRTARRPNNTSGGQLVRGLHARSEPGDRERPAVAMAGRRLLPPGAAEGDHSLRIPPGGCRQVREPSIAMNMGWRTPATQSAMILARD